MLPPCFVFDEVLSFKQRKKVPKEAPQGTDGSLTSFILQEVQTKTGLNVALSLLLFSLPHRSKM